MPANTDPERSVADGTPLTHDIAIVGGGPVGCSLALALSGHGLRLALVESRLPGSATAESAVGADRGVTGQDHDDKDSAFAGASKTGTDTGTRPLADQRSYALAYGSWRILTTLGLTASLASTPIHAIHVSEAGQPGMAHLDRRDEGVEALGHVVLAHDLDTVLTSALDRCADLERYRPATVDSVNEQLSAVTLELQTDGGRRQLRSRLLLAADGTDSAIRSHSGIGVTVCDYGQTAIVANIKPALPHRHIAYERFTPEGPVALLPLGSTHCALVYTVADHALAATMALDDAAFLAKVQQQFGNRLGRLLEVGRRAAFPVRRVTASNHGQTRIALLGNAAQTLHPVAGQGLNLGLRDVAALAEVVVSAQRAGRDIGATGVVASYHDWRRWEQRAAVGFTDGLVRVFSNRLTPLRWARGLGLAVFDLLPPVKHLVARRAMGLAGTLPRLARGLPLSVVGQSGHQAAATGAGNDPVGIRVVQPPA